MTKTPPPSPSSPATDDDAVAPKPRRRRLRARYWVPAGWLLSVAAAVVVTWCAVTATIVPPHLDDESGDGVETVAAHEGSLGRSITIPVQAHWPLSPLAEATTQGLVTDIDVTPGEKVDQGDELLRIDEHPTVIAEGAVPAFRDLSVGMSGRDVAQLQQLLSDLGYYGGEVDGEFGDWTRRAVVDWHKSLGLEGTGTVGASELVFAPTLPARVVLADDLAVGQTVRAGDVVASLVGDEPTFTAILTDDQATLATGSRTILVEHDDDSWKAEVDTISTDNDNQQPVASLLSPDGGSVCGDDCDSDVPVSADDAIYQGQLVVTPSAEGVLVPVAAVMTDAQGATHVVTESGAQRDVDVVLTADGQALVDGIDAGTRVQVTSDDDD